MRCIRLSTVAVKIHPTFYFQMGISAIVLHYKVGSDLYSMGCIDKCGPDTYVCITSSITSIALT